MDLLKQRITGRETKAAHSVPDNNALDIIGCWWTQITEESTTGCSGPVINFTTQPLKVQIYSICNCWTEGREIFHKLVIKPTLLSHRTHSPLSPPSNLLKDRPHEWSPTTDLKWLWKQVIGSHDPRINKCPSESEKKKTEGRGLRKNLSGLVSLSPQGALVPFSFSLLDR